MNLYFTSRKSPDSFKLSKTREYLWNTKRPQPPPDSKGYWLSRICPCFGQENLLGISVKSAISGVRIWSKLSKGTSTGQYLLYEHIHTFLRPSVTKIQPRKESMTDGHPESIGPQPLGLGPNKKRWYNRLASLILWNVL